MGAQTRTQIITGLKQFVEDQREDQLGEYRSLYYALYRQWDELDRIPVDQHKQMAALYWQQMEAWYDRFLKEKERISRREIMPSSDAMGMYLTIVDDMMDAVMAKLPEQKNGPVIYLNDFVLMLDKQLDRFSRLDLEWLTPIDCIMLMEYWRGINIIVENYEEGAE